MMEFPEVQIVGEQANTVLQGKIIADVFLPTNPHKFAFFNGDVKDYVSLLKGKRIISAKGSGMFVDIYVDNDITLSLGDGVVFKYGDNSTEIPKKYQLLIIFEDETFLAFSIAMYGIIFAFKGVFDNKYHQMSFDKISPLSDHFDKDYFGNLIKSEKKNISIKALLASEQRIPGLGNGVLQDILFNVGINPKRKIDSLSERDIDKLFYSIKNTLSEMKRLSGRNTESDFFGNKGKYEVLLSAKTYKNPCPRCNGKIEKEAYMGGSIYYCPICQPLS